MNEPGDKAREDAMVGLIGIRRGLFPEAPPYRPQVERRGLPHETRDRHLWRARAGRCCCGSSSPMRLSALVRRLMQRFDLYRLVWHRALFNLRNVRLPSGRRRLFIGVFCMTGKFAWLGRLALTVIARCRGARRRPRACGSITWRRPGRATGGCVRMWSRSRPTCPASSPRCS